jgi:manganese/zinc/iron transport system substrate-binding protein
VRDALIRLRPAEADAFRRNGDDLARRLVALDAYVKRVIGSIPEQRRVLVTAHDAFGYFARRYGIAVEGIQGLSTEAEAGLRRIQELVEMLSQRGVPAVFVETSVNDRNVRALIEGAAAKGHRVAIGGALFSDAMGPPGTYEGTYVGMMDHNATTIARALGGEAPPKGLNGRLAG